MGENLRFIELIDELKRRGVVSDYVQVAAQLGTNKAAISDIKSGRKKLSVEIIRSLKYSYPSISIEWIIMGEGEPFIETTTERNITQLGDTTIFLDKISKQAEEIGQLKEQVRQLTIEKERLASNVRSSGTANVG
ncbi:hypothetical protein [Prevotella bivia]|uniref:hypothetical protein n=1 Tax=Prevotella bivia TaxID=28125 RepID=UPI000586F25C|nr:hypothetical protein [Prevotella bivia]